MGLQYNPRVLLLEKHHSRLLVCPGPLPRHTEGGKQQGLPLHTHQGVAKGGIRLPVERARRLRDAPEEADSLRHLDVDQGHHFHQEVRQLLPPIAYMDPVRSQSDQRYPPTTTTTYRFILLYIFLVFRAWCVGIIDVFLEFKYYELISESSLCSKCRCILIFCLELQV